MKTILGINVTDQEYRWLRQLPPLEILKNIKTIIKLSKGPIHMDYTFTLEEIMEMIAEIEASYIVNEITPITKKERDDIISQWM